MGKQNNRTCIICNKPYHYCPTCGEDSGKPTWYFLFDGKRCFDIYEICTQYRDKQINAKQAYERISKFDISDLENFAETTRVQIEEIISKGKEIKITSDREKSDNTRTFNKK